MTAWVFKTEPDEFSIDDLQRVQVEPWTGIRNYQARNSLRDVAKPGDTVYLYHSSCAVPALVGVAEITGDTYPDPLQFKPDSDYYDPGARAEEPRWLCLDIRYRRHLKRPLSLEELKGHADALDGILLLKRGNRLSVFPISAAHEKYLLKLEKTAP